MKMLFRVLLLSFLTHPLYASESNPCKVNGQYVVVESQGKLVIESCTPGLGGDSVDGNGLAISPDDDPIAFTEFSAYLRKYKNDAAFFRALDNIGLGKDEEAVRAKFSKAKDGILLTGGLKDRANLQYIADKMNSYSHSSPDADPQKTPDSSPSAGTR